MAKLLDEFIAHLEEEVRNGSIYVWGAQGQGADVISEAWIKRMETSTTNAKRAIALWEKRKEEGFGDVLRAFDCSGLGMAFIQNEKRLSKNDLNANSLMRACEKIEKRELRRGDWAFKVYTSGEDAGRAYHIGYVVDDDLNVIEAQGRDAGAVKRPLSKGKWNAYGRPVKFFGDEVGSGETSAPASGGDAWIVRRVLKLTNSMMRGEDVRELQRRLIARGYACGKNGADGVFGRDTHAAVRAFQGSVRLTIDGKAGKNTVAALGGEFRP